MALEETCIQSQFVNGKLYSFDVQKSKSFKFLSSTGKSFHVNYSFEIRQLNNSILEAYFPLSIWYHIKYLSEFRETLRTQNPVKATTVYYRIGEDDGQIQICNFPELKAQLQSDLSVLSERLNPESKESILSTLDLITESEEQFIEYSMQDLIHLHYCEGLEVESSFSIDFSKNDSILSSVAKHTLRRLKIHMEEGEILAIQNRYPTQYALHHFKFKDAITSDTPINVEQLKKVFLEGNLDFNALKNGTYSLNKYKLNALDHTLMEYHNQFRIHSAKMNKELSYSIRRSFKKHLDNYK